MHSQPTSQIARITQLYVVIVMSVVLVLIYDYAPRMGKTNVFVYVSVCSLVGSISVIGVKVRV